MNASAHPLHARYLEQRKAGDLSDAASTLDRVLASDPRADWACNALIELLHTSGRHGDATTLARTALRINPRNALPPERDLAEDLSVSRITVRKAVAGLVEAGERVGFLEDGRAVEFSQSFYRGDTYDFVAELSAAT